ncbi:DUF2502 domain-containing protein [Enterobacter asburiae]|nr:DUF2502 domain-containing protein [Enterobacter asburiae]
MCRLPAYRAFPVCRAERRSGRSGTDGHYWRGGRAQHRRWQRRARPERGGRYAQRRHDRRAGDLRE